MIIRCFDHFAFRVSSSKNDFPSSPSRILMLLILILFGCRHVSCYIHRLPSPLHLTAPEFVCISGHANPRDGMSVTCPFERGSNYGVHLDETSIVTVTLYGVKITDGRPHGVHRNYDDAKNSYYNKKGDACEDGNEGCQNGKNRRTAYDKHHVQIFLLPVVEYEESLGSGLNICCYEFDASISRNIPKECIAGASMDLRVGTKIDSLSNPISVESPDDSEVGGVTIEATFRPLNRGNHMVILSNCASMTRPKDNETSDESVISTLTSNFSSGQISYASKFGELPLNLRGIVPFYVCMACAYVILVLVWLHCLYFSGRSRKIARNSPRRVFCHLRVASDLIRALSAILPLQRALFYLACCHGSFSVLAAVYYLRLNTVPVDVEVLYGGTAAALVAWGPFSGAVALAHFVTVFACQAVVTFAADGTWLIYGNIRGLRSLKGSRDSGWLIQHSVFAICTLGAAWVGYFLFYGIMSPLERRAYFVVCGVVWIVFLLFSVNRSLVHLRSLIVGNEGERIVVGGGILNAKRGLFRKMYAVVALYPIIFITTLILNSRVSHPT
uniref:Uncharacterized protein n=1 Tax=Corethron hystrix TaxID=216773 RepID=A0A7S1BXS7_9STRA